LLKTAVFDTPSEPLGFHPVDTSRPVLSMSASGHEERFPPTRLSAGCGFRKETIAGMHRNGRDAPIADVA
jgi:hypothetical protein